MKIIYGILLLIVALSCTKDKAPQIDPSNLDIQCDGEIATIRDYTGLDGCGWVLVLQSGIALEPLNLGDFSITPVDGKRVCIKYHVLPVGSICMVGPTVELDSISE